MCVLNHLSCPTLCNPMDCSLPSSSVYGFLQARILEWVTMPFSRVSSLPRDWTRVSCVGRQLLYHWATREALLTLVVKLSSILWSSVKSLSKSGLRVPKGLTSLRKWGHCMPCPLACFLQKAWMQPLWAEFLVMFYKLHLCSSLYFLH